MGEARRKKKAGYILGRIDDPKRHRVIVGPYGPGPGRMRAIDIISALTFLNECSRTNERKE